MASPAASAGYGTGYRRRQDEHRERDLAAQDRKRRHAREDLSMQADRMTLRNARWQSKNAREEYARTQEELRDRNAREGMTDLVYGIQQGVEPGLLLKQFNAKGELGLKDLQYDRESGRITLTDDEGETRTFESPAQLGAAFGIRSQAADPIKLGKDDRLVTPGGEEIVGAVPEAEGGLSPGDRYIEVDGHLYDQQERQWISPPGGGEGAGGRKHSTFNFEGVLGDLTGGIIRHHGGQAGEIQQLQDPTIREIATFQESLAHDMASDLVEELRTFKVTEAEIREAVLDATGDLSTPQELEEKAIKQHPEGWFAEAPTEDRERWIQTERQKERLEAQRKLTEAKQRLLEEGVRARSREGGSATAGQPPEWAGAHYGPAADYGLQPGDGRPFDVLDENGQPTGEQVMLRAGPDGEVYEYREGGQQQPPQSPSRPQMRQMPRLPGQLDTPDITLEEVPRPRPDATLAQEGGQTPAPAPAEGRNMTPEGREQASLAQSRRAYQEQQSGDMLGYGPVIEGARDLASRVGRGHADLKSSTAAGQAYGTEAARVLTALDSGKAPATPDIKKLGKARPDELQALGFSPEQIEFVYQLANPDSPVNASLSDARRRGRAEIPY